jgi:hypothetical protein
LVMALTLTACQPRLPFWPNICQPKRVHCAKCWHHVA